MRSSELTNGVRIMDESGDHLGDSVTAAKWAIAQVRVSTQVLKVNSLLVGVSVILSHNF